jgi:hypothetical protein
MKGGAVPFFPETYPVFNLRLRPFTGRRQSPRSELMGSIRVALRAGSRAPSKPGVPSPRSVFVVPSTRRIPHTVVKQKTFPNRQSFSSPTGARQRECSVSARSAGVAHLLHFPDPGNRPDRRCRCNREAPAAGDSHGDGHGVRSAPEGVRRLIRTNGGTSPGSSAGRQVFAMRRSRCSSARELSLLRGAVG